MNYSKNSILAPASTTPNAGKSVVELCKEKKETIRKNGGCSIKNDWRETCAASDIVGRYWSVNKDPRSISSVTKGVPYEERVLDYKITEPWKLTKGEKKRLEIANEFITNNKYLIPLSISMNIALAPEQRLLKQAINQLMNEPRDQVRKAISSVIGKDYPIYFWLIDEYAKNVRLHFHGCLGIPKEIYSEEVRYKIETALCNIPVCGKHKPRGGNKIVVVSDNYIRKGRQSSQPTDCNWLAYCLKTCGSKSIGKRKLADENGNIILQEQKISISSELRRDTGIAYDEWRRQLKKK